MKKNHEDIIFMIASMCVNSDCLIINQCTKPEQYEFKYKNNTIRCICTDEKGLSRSRNRALQESKADIVLIADDDLIYYKNYKNIIIKAYIDYPEHDIIIFNCDDYAKNYPNYSKKVSFLQTMKFCSFQLSLKRNAIIKNNIFFNTFFGSGSDYYKSGEENIFLSECYKQKIKIFYCPIKILYRINTGNSSWFTGFNNKSFIKARGAVFYALSPHLVYLLILQYAVRKRPLLKPISLVDSIVYMLQGKDEYKQLLTSQIYKIH